jgi:hypothetical protein
MSREQGSLSSGLRVDVRENLEGAARAERFYNGNSIILIADALVDELLKDWSRPVQLRAQRRDDEAIIEITVREQYA